MIRETGEPYFHEPCPADWSNYGVGHPGLEGVPVLTVDVPPVIGTPTTMHLGNSSGAATASALLFGTSEAELDLGVGGLLLVNPVVTIPLTLPADGLALPFLFADGSPIACGATFYYQLLVVDLAASHWVAFSRGMTLTAGH